MPADPDWARHCVDLAAEAAGRDIWAELGGRPGSWREAAALYRRLGARTLAEAVTVILGPPVSPRQARRGDIVMVRGALGICRGEVVECFGATVRMDESAKAWPSKPRRKDGEAAERASLASAGPPDFHAG